jgi:hypothetical protein
MDRRYSQYVAAPPRRFRRLQLFRGVTLNAVGRGAVILLCLAGAGVAYLAGRVTGSAGTVTAPAGALAAFIAVVMLDRRRWGRLETSFSWGDDPDAVVRATVALQWQGLPVWLEVDPDGRPRLRYRNRDGRRVRRALARAGVPIRP